MEPSDQLHAKCQQSTSNMQLEIESVMNYVFRSKYVRGILVQGSADLVCVDFIGCFMLLLPLATVACIQKMCLVGLSRRLFYLLIKLLKLKQII